MLATSAQTIAYYDNDGSLAAYGIQRTSGSGSGAWATYAQNGVATPAQNTYQSVLTSLAVTRDVVGNPIEIDQNDGHVFGLPAGLPPGQQLPLVVPSEWPPGAAPTDSVFMSYGDAIV